MQHTKKPYEIDTSAIQKAGQPNPLRDILRGLVADTRGLLEARQMQRTAADAKQQTIADEAYRQRVANVQERRVQLTESRDKSNLDLDTQEFDEKKRIQTETENLEKAKTEALKGLKETWAKGHSEFYDLERELREAKREREQRDAPDEIADMEIQKLESRLQKVGTWLERNAEDAEFPAFDRYNEYLDTDEEARVTAEETDKIEKQSERTLAAINDPEIFTDEAQRTRLLKLHTANPEMPLKELIELQTEALESGEVDDTETIRNDKMTIWNAHKAEIMKQHGEGVWQSVASEIKYSDTPEKIDVNTYLQKDQRTPKTPPKEDNPHILAGEHAREAALALGESPAIAEEKKRAAIIASTADDEGGTQLERVLNLTKNLKDPMRKYIESAGIKSTSSRKVMSNVLILTNQALRGETEEAMENLADIWTTNATKTDKAAPSRMADAIIAQNTRDKLIELKTVYGIKTGRLNQKYIDAMSKGEFIDAFKVFGFETVGGGYTDEQIRALASAEVYIKRQFAEFLKTLSGTAASDTERANLMAINPNLFMAEGMNIGIIDGNIEYLRDREFALFTENSDREFAAKVMAAKGWDDIKLSTETQEGEWTEETRLTSYVGTITTETEDEFVEIVKLQLPNTDEKTIRKAYQDSKKE